MAKTPAPWHTGTTWRQVRAEVLERDLDRCQIRGPGCEGRANTADHIVSPRDGGAWFDPANLRAACRTCNSRRGASFQRELRRPSPTDPGPSRKW